MALAFGVTPIISVESLDQTGLSLVVVLIRLELFDWSQLRSPTLSHWSLLLVGSRGAIPVRLSPRHYLI